MAQTQGNFISAPAGADLHASAHLIVKLNSSGQAILATAATDDIVGVLEEVQQASSGVSTSGGSVSIAHISGSGTGEVIAGGSISKGAFLTSNGSGQAVATVENATGVLATAVLVLGGSQPAAK